MHEEDINERTEESIRKKFRKKLFSRFTKAIVEYELIQPNDKIAVCISGGKDSFAMAKLFQELKRHNKIPFEIIFLLMDPGYNAENREKIETNAKLLNIPLTVFETDIFESVFNIEKSPCYLCARMRRGHLYHRAKDLGCNKIALGHHLDDVDSTLMLNMFYGGRLKSMPPKLLSDAKEHIVIRPLVYLREKDWARWCRIKGYDVIPKLCGADDVCRREMKEIIQRMDRETLGRVENIFRSLTRVAPSHLLDQTLFDFKDLEKERITPETPEEV